MIYLRNHGQQDQQFRHQLLKDHVGNPSSRQDYERDSLRESWSSTTDQHRLKWIGYTIRRKNDETSQIFALKRKFVPIGGREHFCITFRAF